MIEDMRDLEPIPEHGNDFIADVRKRIIDYTNWLAKQNLMICEGVDGYTFRSSMIGGKKYTAEELYEKFVSEYVA